MGATLTAKGEASAWAHFENIEQVLWAHRAPVEARVSAHAAPPSIVMPVGIVMRSLLVVAECLRAGVVRCQRAPAANVSARASELGARKEDRDA